MPKQRRRVTIQEVYPVFSPEEEQEAEQRLDAYLAVIRGIYERKHGGIRSDAGSED